MKSAKGRKRRKTGNPPSLQSESKFKIFVEIMGNAQIGHDFQIGNPSIKHGRQS